jgi:hypothetical protein
MVLERVASQSCIDGTNGGGGRMQSGNDLASGMSRPAKSMKI